MQINQGSFPLNSACDATVKELWSERILLALDAAPSAARLQVHGTFPLHTACRNASCSLQVVERLIGLHPPAVKIGDSDGNLPLALACLSKSSAAPAVVETLHLAFPGALRIKNSEGDLPLHIACSNPSSTAAQVCFYLLAPYPEGLHIFGKDDALPLHLACRQACSLELIQHMVQLMGPECTSTRTKSGQLPLHLALCAANHQGKGKATSLQAVQIVRYLAVAAPHTLREVLPTQNLNATRSMPRLPLHAACEGLHAVEVIIEMAKLYREALWTVTSDGRLPLHIACKHARSAVLVRGIVQLYPAALARKCHEGQVALHYACTNTSKEAHQIVQYLLQAAPQASRIVDMSGRYPLHCAAESATSAAVVAAIAFAMPAAVLSKHRRSKHKYDEVEDSLPIHILLSRTNSKSVPELARMVQALLDVPAAKQQLIHRPDATGKGETLAARYAYRGFSYSTEPHIMQTLLQAAPNAIWTISSAGRNRFVENVDRGIASSVTSVIDEVRRACEAAWSLKWSPKSRMHHWMPPKFKRAISSLLLAKHRQGRPDMSCGLKTMLGDLPQEIILRIIRWLACAETQPPFLTQSWHEARKAIQEEMNGDQNAWATTTAQAIVNGNLMVTAEQFQMDSDLLKAEEVRLSRVIFHNSAGESVKVCDMSIEGMERELCHDMFACNLAEQWESRRQMYVWLFARCESEKQSTFVSVPLAFQQEETAIMHEAHTKAELDCHAFLAWAQDALCPSNSHPVLSFGVSYRHQVISTNSKSTCHEADLSSTQCLE